MTPTRMPMTPLTPATTAGLQLVVAYLHWPTCLVEEDGAVQRLLVRAEAAVRRLLAPSAVPEGSERPQSGAYQTRWLKAGDVPIC